MAKGRSDQFLEIGIVVRAHGIRGKIKVRTYSGETDGLSCVKKIYFEPENLKEHFPGIDTEEGLLPFHVSSTQQLKNHALLHLRSVENIGTARLFVNRKVFVMKSDLPETGEDEYYCFELEGFTVVDEEGKYVGKVKEVLPSPAHDILSVVTEKGERLIPFIEEFVHQVSREKRTIVIQPVRGLLEDEV